MRGGNLWNRSLGRFGGTVDGCWGLRTFKLGFVRLLFAGSSSIFENCLSKRLALIVSFLGESDEYLGHFGGLKHLLVNGLEFCDQLDDTISHKQLQEWASYR